MKKVTEKYNICLNCSHRSFNATKLKIPKRTPSMPLRDLELVYHIQYFMMQKDVLHPCWLEIALTADGPCTKVNNI